MKLSQEERLVLDRLGKDEIRIIPEELVSKFTPETLQFTLAQLQAKGLVEYMEGAYIPTDKAQKLFKKKKIIKEEIIAWGHPKITATDKRKIEITRREDVGEDGCVIAVKADKACTDLSDDFKDYLKLGKSVKITISVDGIEDKIMGYGSPALILNDEKSIIIRKSDFIDDKTMIILADKATRDLKRELVERLKSSKTRIKILLESE